MSIIYYHWSIKTSVPRGSLSSGLLSAGVFVGNGNYCYEKQQECSNEPLLIDFMEDVLEALLRGFLIGRQVRFLYLRLPYFAQVLLCSLSPSKLITHVQPMMRLVWKGLELVQWFCMLLLYLGLQDEIHGAFGEAIAVTATPVGVVRAGAFVTGLYDVTEQGKLLSGKVVRGNLFVVVSLGSCEKGLLLGVHFLTTWIDYFDGGTELIPCLAISFQLYGLLGVDLFLLELRQGSVGCRLQLNHCGWWPIPAGSKLIRFDPPQGKCLFLLLHFVQFEIEGVLDLQLKLDLVVLIGEDAFLCGPAALHFPSYFPPQLQHLPFGHVLLLDGGLHLPFLLQQLHLVQFDRPFNVEPC